MLTVEEMREHSVRLQGELESSTISISCKQSLQIVLHNLNSLIESYVGVGPSTHIFYDMMRRRRMAVMGHHKFEEIKTIVTKEMVFSLFDLRPEDKRRLKIARFNDPNIAPHIYLRFLYAYGKFPNNDEVPQYFVKMLIAEFRLHMDPDYTDTGSPFYGAGKGHTYERPDSL